MIGWCMGWAILLVSAGATPGGCVEIRTSSSQNPVSREGTTSFFFFFGCSCLGFCRVLFVVVVTFVFFCCGCCRGRGVCLLLGFYVFFPFVVWLVLGFFRCYWFLLLFCCFLVRGPWLSPWHTHTHTHTHVCARTFCLSVVSVNLSVSLSMHLICASVENWQKAIEKLSFQWFWSIHIKKTIYLQRKCTQIFI